MVRVRQESSPATKQLQPDDTEPRRTGTRLLLQEETHCHSLTHTNKQKETDRHIHTLLTLRVTSCQTHTCVQKGCGPPTLFSLPEESVYDSNVRGELKRQCDSS